MGNAPDNPELDQELRFETFATWSYVHKLVDRLGVLEEWRAAKDAVEAWRRWAVPLAFTVLNAAIGVASYLASRR